MEVLLYDLKLDEIKPFGDLIAKKGTVLWVLHADKIPPHIGISAYGSYFSLKFNGKDDSISFDTVIEIVKRRGIKTLLFDLKLSFSDLDLKMVFDKYAATKSSRITCLKPVKEILNIDSARVLKDLLAELKVNGLIKAVYGLNIDNEFEGLKDYELSAIHDRLKTLENGKD